MSAEGMHPMSRPSTSQQHSSHPNGHKRRRTSSVEEVRSVLVHPSLRASNSDGCSSNPNALPLSDQNAWFYPSHGYDSDDEELPAGSQLGNWGNKTVKGARWARKGKITSWGPGMDDWEVSDTLSIVIVYNSRT